MAEPATLPGVTSSFVDTPRLRIHLLATGPADGVPVVFLHGNWSAATLWEELMLALPAGFRGLAPDLRGYGLTEDKPIDATRGGRDWADDLEALHAALGLERMHLVASSMGAAAAMQYLIDHPGRVLTLTLAAPLSPYGVGGTKDLEGTPCDPDFAGTGAVGINPEFVRRLAAADRSDDATSPRAAINSMWYKPPFRAAREEEFLTAAFLIKMGPDRYPGDVMPSAYWPMAAPGHWGPNNAMSGKYFRVDAITQVQPKPPILWVRGTHDLIVSDMSMADLAVLGKLGYLPGWPGDEVRPPQPMLGQTRAVLERYQANGGRYREVVIADTGHCAFIEKPAEFNAAFHAFLRG